MMPSKNTSLWTQSKILESLSKKSLFDLFDKRIPGIIIPRFVSEADCAKIVSILLREDIPNYTNTPDVDIGKFGLSHMECFEAGEQLRYFSEAGAAQEKLCLIFEMVGIDPLKKLQDLIKNTSNLPVSIPIEQSLNKSTYYAGIFRVIRSGIPPHFDSASLEYPSEVGVSRVNAQLSWNLYLTEVPSGGELVLYEMDAGHLRQTGMLGPLDWLVPTEVLHKVSVIQYKPKVGDIVLFNSQCIHSVNKPDGCERITMSSFIGHSPESQIWFWS